MLLMRREKSTLMKQQKAEQRIQQQQQQQQQQNITNIISPSLFSTTTTTPSINNTSPSLQSIADEKSNFDLNVDTESFPTLDDAVECCSEWDFGSYQCDDLPLMCDFQF